MKNFACILIAMPLVLMVAFKSYSQDVFKSANVGIGTITPQQKLDVVGNVKFSGALMPAAVSGNAGNILLSAGAGVAPTWLSNGTSGQVLAANATGIPTWTTPSLTGGWSLIGNSIASTNFLGTTDAEPLIFKVNNSQAGRIDLNFGVSGSEANTYLGSFGILGAITYGSPGGSTGDGGTLNVGIGISALGGVFATPLTGGNVAVGAFAYPAAPGGDWDVAIGAYSQFNETFINANQGYNTAIGAYAMYSNSTGANSSVVGSYNNAIGYESMYGSGAPTIYGNYNTAIGTYSLYNVSSGGSNTALGSNALYNTTAGRNVGVGDSALYSNITGEYNTTLGYQSNVGGSNLTNATAIGYQATAPVSNSITLGNVSVAYNAGTGAGLYLPGYSTTGSLFYTSATSGLVSALAPGASGTVLESNGSGAAPTWASVSGVNLVSGTVPIYVTGTTASPIVNIQGTSADQGSILYSAGVGTSAVFLSTGTSGYVLQSNGTNPPSWVSQPLGSGWLLTGNSNTTPGTQYLGTTNDEGLEFHVGAAGTAGYAGALDPINSGLSAANVYLGAASTSSPVLPGAGNMDAGNNNVAIGLAAFASAGGPQNVGGNTGSTSGYISSDVAVGVYAMSSCVYGGGNTALGAYSERFFSLPTVNSTSGNTAAGAYSMYSNSTGLYNTALGYYSMYGSGSATAVGWYNTAEGYQSLYTAGAGGASNTAVGSNSLYNNTASRNTAVGDSALVSNTVGTNNTAVGYDADVALNSLTNATAIGYQAQAPVSNSITLGNSSVTSLYLPGYTSVGNILYTSATSGLVSALTPGTAGTVLESSGTGAAPQWLTVSPPNSVNGIAPIYSSGGTAPNISIQGNSLGTDAGGVLYSTGATSAVFTSTPSSAGLVLTSQAGGLQPQWLAAPSATGAWSITGNASTTPGTNFVGTTATTPGDLMFKVDGVVAGSLDYTTNDNSYFGYGVGRNGATVGAGGNGDYGSSNVGLGFETLGNIPASTAVTESAVVGAYAMYNATAASFDVAIGAYTQYNNSGADNVSVGSYSLYSNTSGVSETALGYYSMYGSGTAVAMGAKNTAVGYESLYSITAGGSNTAVGSQALYSSTGGKNTALGDSALASNTTGEYNTADGYQALVNTAGSNGNTTGTYNTALGYYANVASGALTNATAIGAYAYAAQSNSLVLGSINGVNNATANTNVGIGTNAPDADAALAIKTGHLETQAASTNTTAAPFAGSSVTGVTTPVIGTDVGGVVTFTAPANQSAGGQVTVTFAVAYITAPTVIISPSTAATGAIMGTYQPYVGTPLVSGATTSGFTISFGSSGTAASTPCSFNYFVIETQ